MKTTIPFLYLIISLLAGCSSQRKMVDNQQDQIHSGMNSLDWSGTYVGKLPCADCEAIMATMTLNPDLTYVYQWRYLGKGNDLYIMTGDFNWGVDGNSITLETMDTDSVPKQYAVAENKIVQYDIQGKPIKGDVAQLYVLRKDVTQFTANEWRLVEVNGKAVPGDKNLNSEPVLKFNAEEGKVSGNGSCNQFFGQYRVDDNNSISFRDIGATKMACAEMETEKLFFEALRKAERYTIEGDTLILQQEDGTTNARFVKAD